VVVYGVFQFNVSSLLCLCISSSIFHYIHIYVSAFRDRGVLGPTSEISLRAPAQMGRREAEREGGRKVAGDGRDRGGNPTAFVFVPRPGRVRLQ
jgi:hypothetical protein